MGEGEMRDILSIHPLWGFKSSFTCRKILGGGDLPALLPIREEGVLRIFIALKNPSPWPGFEPAIFGSSGQATTPPRRPSFLYMYF
jgi:hypothetical protein